MITKEYKEQKLVTLDVEKILKEYYNMSISYNKLLKLKILRRDGFKCKNCKTNSNLTIAHIIPIKTQERTFKHYEDMNNCLTLCSKCHTYADNNDIDLKKHLSFKIESFPPNEQQKEEKKIIKIFNKLFRNSKIWKK